MPRIVGLDLSLTRTGIAIITEDGQYADVGHVVSKNDWSLQRRIDIISHRIMRACLYPAPLVFIEEHLKAPKMSGKAYDRAELAGVVKFLLWKEVIPFYMIHPSTLKKYVTGKGNEGDKDIILHKVATKFGIEPENSDQADAAAIADFGFNIFSEAPRRSLVKYELDVLAKWRKEFLNGTGSK